MRLRVYSLALNGEQLVEVTLDSPGWLPVKPRLNPRWLRGLVAQAISRYFSARVVRA